MQYVCECMYEVMYEMLEDNGLSKRVKEDRHYPIKRIVCGPLCTLTFHAMLEFLVHPRVRDSVKTPFLTKQF